MKYSDCTIPTTGDVCKGDVVLFEESVFGGYYKNSTYLGSRKIMAEIVSDSYGDIKQQHTFSLRLIRVSGYDTACVRKKAKKGIIHRRGRNIYRRGTLRAPWTDESARREVLEEKHQQGDAARSARYKRIFS